MLYHAYEMQRSLLNGAAAWASVGAEMLSNPRNPMGYMGTGPILASALEVFAHAYAPRGKPDFGIETVQVDGKAHTVEEAVRVAAKCWMLRSRTKARSGWPPWCSRTSLANTRIRR